jgi:hypothetical protein
MTTKAIYKSRVQGVDLSEDEVDDLIEDNIADGRAYGLVTEGLLEITVLGRTVVPVLRGRAPGLNFSSLWGAPKVTIRCGACARSSKSEVVPLTINDTLQESSLIFCDHCGTANIANIYAH